MPPMGIVFISDASPVIGELAEALFSLGLCREHGESGVLTPELLDALNDYREANCMVELDFCDPSALRALGIDCTGDDVMLLARYGEAVTESEIGCYDACAEAISEAKRLDLTLCGYIGSRVDIGRLPLAVSEEAVSAALLAALS